MNTVQYFTTDQPQRANTQANIWTVTYKLQENAAVNYAIFSQKSGPGYSFMLPDHFSLHWAGRNKTKRKKRSGHVRLKS